MKGLKAIYTIWLRDFKLFLREKSQIVGMIGQPLLYLLVVGTGITASMSLNGSGGIDYIKFMYPGIIGMSILFTALFSAISIIWDRQFGMLKEVLVAPVPRWGVALGKSFGGATVATLQTIILVALAPVVGVSLSVGIVLGLLAIAFLISFAVTSFGVAIASRMTSMQGFQMLMNFLILPMYFLSGGMFPIETAPAWMKTAMVINPLSYGIDALRNVIFSGTSISVNGVLTPLADLGRAAGLIRWDLSFDIAVMALVTAVLTILGTVAFSKGEV